MALKFRNPFYSEQPAPQPTPAPEVKPASADYGRLASEANIGWGEPSPGFIPSGGAIGGVYGYNWHFVARRAEKMAVLNGIFHRLHEIIRDNVCGQGLDLDPKVKDDSPHKAILDSVIKNVNFFGKVNRLDLAITQWVCEHILLGELPVMPNVNEKNGDIQWLYVPPRLIRDIEVNGFTNQPLSVQLDYGLYDENTNKMNWDDKDRFIDIIRVSFDAYMRDKNGEIIYEGELPKVNPNAGKLVGGIFYLRSGNVISQARGQGEGFPVMDMILEMENFQYNFAKAFALQTSITFDIEIQDADQAACDAEAKVKLPSGRVPWVHNQKKKLTFLQPTLKIEDMSNAVRTYMVQIGGSLGVPEYMMGDGSQTNVATAREQAPALYQTQVEDLLSQMLRYFIEQKNDRKMLHDENGKEVVLTVKQLDDIDFNVKFRPFERNNLGEIAELFKSVVDTSVAAVAGKVITPELARELVHAQVQQLGVEVDVDRENKILGNTDLTGTGASGQPIDASMLK
jgi:hypothetical protein